RRSEGTWHIAFFTGRNNNIIILQPFCPEDGCHDDLVFLGSAAGGIKALDMADEVHWPHLQAVRVLAERNNCPFSVFGCLAVSIVVLEMLEVVKCLDNGVQ